MAQENKGNGDNAELFVDDQQPIEEQVNIDPELEVIKELRKNLSGYNKKWAVGLHEVMKQEPVIRARYDNGMPISVIYSISNGTITNPVLREVFIECATQYLEVLKRA